MKMSLLDKRVVRRNIAKGLLSQQEYDEHMKNLDDLSDKLEEVEVTLFPSDEEEEEEEKENEEAETGAETASEETTTPSLDGLP